VALRVNSTGQKVPRQITFPVDALGVSFHFCMHVASPACLPPTVMFATSPSVQLCKLFRPPALSMLYCCTAVLESQLNIYSLVYQWQYVECIGSLNLYVFVSKQQCFWTFCLSPERAFLCLRVWVIIGCQSDRTPSVALPATRTSCS
jgi:hypothetical protein